MSDYYNPRRSRNLFDPESPEPFRVSRSKIDLFLNCQLCFYLDRKLGVGRPPGFPFNLNSAVDTLLKKEFDIHRAAKSSHPLMDAYGLKNVVPYADSRMDAWRDALKRGVTFVHKPTNFLVTGGVDLIPYKGNDSWVEKALADMHTCLLLEKPPKPDAACDYCKYRKAARDVQQEGKK